MALADKIKSPCVKNCTLDVVRSLCQGCKRTLKEITEWPVLSEKERKEIIYKLKKR